MKYSHKRCFLINISSHDEGTLNAWDLMMETIRSDPDSFDREFAMLMPGNDFLTHFTVGSSCDKDRHIFLTTQGLNEKHLFPPSVGKRLLVLILWDMFKSQFKGWTTDQKPNERAEKSIIRCMERDIEWEEVISTLYDDAD